MSEAAKRLVGRRIESAERVHDYVQLRFDDGGILNIYNPVSITGGADAGLLSLLRSYITAVRVDDEAIRWFLSNGTSIQVSMRDADYRGPEAMQYVAVDGAIVVWP